MKILGRTSGVSIPEMKWPATRIGAGTNFTSHERESSPPALLRILYRLLHRSFECGVRIRLIDIAEP